MGWTVFRVLEAFFNPAHAQHLALFHGIIEVTNLKTHIKDRKRFKIVVGTVY